MIRIFGLEDTKEKETVEESVEKVVKFVKTKLKVPLQAEDIDITHRLGRFDNSKRRSVIVKFTHRRKKYDILSARSVLKKSPYSISEDLTKYNQDRLHQAYRLDCVEKTFSVDGKLFVVLKAKNQRDRKKIRRILYDTPLTEDYLLNDSNFRRTS